MSYQFAIEGGFKLILLWFIPFLVATKLLRMSRSSFHLVWAGFWGLVTAVAFTDTAFDDATSLIDAVNSLFGLQVTVGMILIIGPLYELISWSLKPLEINPAKQKAFDAWLSGYAPRVLRITRVFRFAENHRLWVALFWLGWAGWTGMRASLAPIALHGIGDSIGALWLLVVLIACCVGLVESSMVTQWRRAGYPGYESSSSLPSVVPTGGANE